MHFTSLLAQTILATAVVGAGIPSAEDNMGWRDSKAQALRNAADAKAKWSGSGPVAARDWQDDRDKGLAQAAAAVEGAKKAAAAFNSKDKRDWQADRDAAIAKAHKAAAAFSGNDKRDWEADRDAGLAKAADWEARAKKAAAAFNSKGKRDGQMYGGDDDVVPNNNWGGAPQPTGYPGNYYPNGQKGWQDDAASARGDAAQWQAYGSSVGAEWQAYGSSVAASASAQWAGQDGDWQSAASSAQSLASSYRSEYGVSAQPTPTVAQTPAAKPQVGTVGAAGVATPTPNMVQVNGAVEGSAGIGAAMVLGAGAAVFAVAAGML
ncbi:hypothetical protein OQA88_4172 [Cercophora sp. LCS_1]